MVAVCIVFPWVHIVLDVLCNVDNVLMRMGLILCGVLFLSAEILFALVVSSLFLAGCPSL